MNLKDTHRADVPLVEFMYLVFTRMPGESYRKRLRSFLLYLCYVFRELFNSLMCWLYRKDLTCQSTNFQGFVGGSNTEVEK